MKKPRIIIEENPRGLSIISEIADSECLHIGVLITRDQIGRLIRGGWSVKRRGPTEASSRKRARSGCFLRLLSSAEITAAIKHPESDESDAKAQRRGAGDEEE